MNATWSLFVIASPRHVRITCTSVDNEQHLSRYLRTQETCLVIPDFLPLWKVLWYLGEFDARRRLRMTSMHMVR